MYWLVTGGNGFLGRRMVEMLVEQGIQVKSFDISIATNKVPNAVYVQGDLRSLEDCNKATEGCDVVLHVASLTELHGAKSLFDSINVGGTKTLLRAAKNSGVRAFVYTSTSSVVYEGKDIENGDESLPYATNFIDYYTETKARAEQAVLAANCDAMHTCAVRPHSIYGPGDRHYFPKVLAQAAKGKLKFRLGSGQPLSSYTYVDNCVHAHICAAKALQDPSKKVGGKAYFVNDGEPRPFWGVMKQIAVMAGYDGDRIAIRSIPFGVAHCLGGTNEAIHTIGKAVCGEMGDPVFTRFSVAMACTHHYYSTEKAHKELGYQAIVDSSKAMNTTMQYFREAGLGKQPPSPKNWLAYWLFFVSLASAFGSIQGFFFHNILRTKQFSNEPSLVTPTTANLFGVWTGLAAILRLTCSFNINDKPLFRCTQASFGIALAFYYNEVFRTQTVPLTNAVAPFIIASVSFIWMWMYKPSRTKQC